MVNVGAPEQMNTGRVPWTFDAHRHRVGADREADGRLRQSRIQPCKELLPHVQRARPGFGIDERRVRHRALVEMHRWATGRDGDREEAGLGHASWLDGGGLI